jgi:dCMP deaminase
MTKNEYYLDIALTVAKKSTCLKKHYGAVIVNNDEIVATGFNGPARNEPHCEICTKKQGNGDMDEYCSCPAIHAEMNAIISAARKEMVELIFILRVLMSEPMMSIKKLGLVKFV